MRIVMVLLGAVLGGLLGIVAGVAVSMVILLAANESPRNPGAEAQSLISLVLTIPGGFLFGVLQGIRFARARWERRDRD